MDKDYKTIINLLKNEYPNSKCGLEYKTPFELLVAAILSAQTTDIKVNQITKGLFFKYPTYRDFLSLKQEDLEAEIKMLGLYKNKAKNILAMCKQLDEKYRGIIPNTLEELTIFSGVGRKTANVILSNIFGIPAIAVDTHVFRVANRIGLIKAKNAFEAEIQLQKALDTKYWILAHNLLVWHGRKCCTARKPRCEDCVISGYCITYEKCYNMINV